MNERQLWALTTPLDTSAVSEVVKRRQIDHQPDGSLLVTVLAVDR